MGIKYDAIAKNGSYTDKNGVEKFKWCKVGIVVETKNIFTKLYLFYFLKNENLKSLDSGSAQSMITTGDLYRHQILSPKIEVQKDFELKIQTILNHLEYTNKETQILEVLKELLLGRMVRN